MFDQYVSRIEHHMYKSWIRANPELAMRRIMEHHNKMMELGMMVRVEECDHYYDMIGERL